MSSIQSNYLCSFSDFIQRLYSKNKVLFTKSMFPKWEGWQYFKSGAECTNFFFSAEITNIQYYLIKNLVLTIFINELMFDSEIVQDSYLIENPAETGITEHHSEESC